jgi:hypothetical protein
MSKENNDGGKNTEPNGSSSPKAEPSHRRSFSEVFHDSQPGLHGKFNKVLIPLITVMIEAIFYNNMDKPKFFIYSIALALTIAIWSAAFGLTRHFSQSAKSDGNESDSANQSAHPQSTLGSLSNSQRAVLAAEPGRWLSHYEPTSGHVFWTFYPVWFNFGPTATKDLKIAVMYALADRPLEDDFGFPDHPGLVHTPMWIAPNARINGSETPMIDGELLRLVQDGKKHFYIYGWAKYHDAFDGTPEHTTRFCWKITSIRGDSRKEFSESNRVEVNTEFHHKFNSAD